MIACGLAYKERPEDSEICRSGVLRLRILKLRRCTMFPAASASCHDRGGPGESAIMIRPASATSSAATGALYPGSATLSRFKLTCSYPKAPEKRANHWHANPLISGNTVTSSH